MPGMSGLLTAGAGFAARRALLRIMPWTWPLWVALGTVGAVRHELTERQRERLLELLRKGIPLPTSLTARQQTELLGLLARVDPLIWARFVAAEVSPLPWPKAPAARGV